MKSHPAQLLVEGTQQPNNKKRSCFASGMVKSKSAAAGVRGWRRGLEPHLAFSEFQLPEVKTVQNIMRRRRSSGTGLRSSASVYKFLVFRLQEQNTFWDFITDAPHFRYGGSFTFDKAMQEKALAVKVAIKEFREALEQRQEKKS